MIVALALSPSLDVTYEVDELRAGDITRPRAITRVAGGKALNVVRVAHALGASARAVAALGGHTGAHVADLLRADGVAVDVVALAGQTRTCTAIVDDRAGASSTDLYEPPTTLSGVEWHAFADAARHAGADASTVVFSGSVPAGVDVPALASLLAQLRAAGARIAIDSSGPALRVLAPHADVLKINRVEAGELLGVARTAREAARALAAGASGAVIVTDGVHGGTAILGGREIALDPPRTTGRFSAGSGDAFLGGLLAALEAGAEPAAALRLASRAAERNALCPGQGILA